MAGKFADVEEGMRQVLGFWMWFQDNDPKGMWGRGPWHGIFDWGDWQTRYTDIHGKPGLAVLRGPLRLGLRRDGHDAHAVERVSATARGPSSGAPPSR